MKAVVTGANGFIGKNLVVALRRASAGVTEIDVDSPPDALLEAVSGARIVYHLAGVNRPDHESEFVAGNVGSLDALFAAVDESVRTRQAIRPLIVLSSSLQATCDNPYGRSKLAAEHALEAHAGRTGGAAVIYRLPGVFGKWCRPDYNSVVATFCHNIARDLPIAISDPSRVIELVHIDDVVAQFMAHLDGKPEVGVVRGDVAPRFSVTLGELAERLRGFRRMRDTLLVSDASDPLTRRLLATYTSYIPLDDLAYPLQQRTDARGTLAELLKSPHFGQIFVSRTKPGVTRGNHYHDLKVEKFCVLEGDAVIRFRPILGAEVTEHRVSGKDFRVVDIPPGVTHSIENVGSAEMIVLFWASEILDPGHPDTHSAEVLRG